MKKLKILESKSHAFSTDCDEHAKERAVQMKKNYEMKKIIENPSKIQKLLKVPSIKNFSDEDTDRYCESDCKLGFNFMIYTQY